MIGLVFASSARRTDELATKARGAKCSVFRNTMAGIACALLTGCYDTKQEITLNPDGTGKAVIESTFANIEPLPDGTARPGPDSSPRTYLENLFEESASSFLQKLIQEAEGVDAWRDISYREMDDGRVLVRATVYFADLSKLNTKLNGSVRFKVTKDPAGLLVISPKPDTSRSPWAFPATNEPVTAESIKHERKKFRAMQPFLAAMFGAMKLDSTFCLPGVVRRASNFDTNAAGALQHRFDGARAIAAVERVIFDPDFSQQRLSVGATQSALLENNLANESLYGKRAPTLAVIKRGSKPLFDYAAEVAAARQAFPSLARKLGLNDEAEPPKPAVSGTPAAVAVIGMSWRFNPESSRLFLDGTLRGYMLNLRAVLPGAVLEVKGIQFTRALTVEGLALKASLSFFRRRSPTDATTGLTNLDFEVYLSSPPLTSKGIAELSGYLECESMENLQTIELFNGRLGPGARSSDFGTEIEFIGPYTLGGEKIILRSDLPPDRWLSLKLVTGAGQTIELRGEEPMTVGSQHTYTFVAPRSIPRSGKLVAGIFKGAQPIRIPFTLTNLSLLGQPLAAR